MATEGGGGGGGGGLFHLASREFEEEEEEESEGDAGDSLDPAEEDGLPQHKEPRAASGGAPPLPREPSEAQRPEGPPPVGLSAAEVALAVRDMERFMGHFRLGLEDVAQAFLKNSGEVAAVDSCLRMGRRSDGGPLWSRQDDMDLMKGDQELRRRLAARYGPENVEKREAFRRS